MTAEIGRSVGPCVSKRKKRSRPVRPQPTSRTQGLGAGQNIRLQPKRLASPKVPSPSESVDYLIRNQQHIVFLQHLLDGFVVPLGGDNDTTSSQGGLAKHGSAAIGATLGDNQLLQLPRTPGDKHLLGLALFVLLVVMRGHGMLDLWEREVEIFVVGGEAGERSRGDGDAVVAPEAGDDFLFVGAVQGVVVVPDDLLAMNDRDRSRMGSRGPVEGEASGRERQIEHH